MWIASTYNAYVWCGYSMLAIFLFTFIRNCYGKFIVFLHRLIVPAIYSSARKVCTFEDVEEGCVWAVQNAGVM